MKIQPLVSIIIPAYNAANYLSCAIESALAQTYKNIEIIVVNDGSTDNSETKKVADLYKDKIRYFEKENGGSSSALNYGIKMMRGEWFSWLSHDDVYYPEKIEKQVEILKDLHAESKDLYKHVFFGAADLIDEHGKFLKKSDRKINQLIKKYLDHLEENGELIANPTKYNFHGCSCLIHKNAFDAVGNFNENLRLINDWDMWFRLYAEGYKVHYIAEPIVKGRIHQKQISNSIGYSYHNSEQDWFWKRSFEWLCVKCPKEYKLFCQFGKNAYLKTRIEDGDNAFAVANLLKPKKKVFLLIKKRLYILYANVRNFLKTIYFYTKI